MDTLFNRNNIEILGRIRLDKYLIHSFRHTILTIEVLYVSCPVFMYGYTTRY